MKRGVVRIVGLAMLVLVRSAAAAAQDTAEGAPQQRWSLEGAAGVQIHYTGTVQSVAFGFAPTRNLTLLLGAERSRIADEIEIYPDGSSSERGGRVQFISVMWNWAGRHLRSGRQ